MTNLPAQLSTLRQQISALTEKFAPANADEIGQCIEGLMSGGMRLSDTITAKNPVEEYRVSLRDVPVYGLRLAYAKLKRGEYENINRAFIPLPAELAAMANAECRVIREDRVRATERMRALSDAQVARQDESTCRDPNTRARVRKMLEEFRGWHRPGKENEARCGTPVMTPSAEQIDTWSKVMALPDAPNITAEQMAFRRKVQADIDAATPIEEQKAA